MTKTLYIMRHGETLFNRQNRVQGWCDSPLTEAGKAQALMAKTFFDREQITFDVAYSSTQERACDTLELITPMPYTRLKGIKEWHFGLFEAQPNELMPKRRQTEKSFEDLLVPYGGEDRQTVGERAIQTITTILEIQSDGSTTLMVSHGGLLWALFLTLGLDKQRHPELMFGNCCIFHYEYDQQKFLLKRCINPVENIVHT